MIRPGIRRLFRLPLRRRDVAEQEIEEEIRLHLELREAQLARRGLSPEAARTEAMRRFGPLDEARQVLREASQRREDRMRTREWIDTLRQDLQFAVRQLLRSPGFTLTAVLTLALGIGANSAIFTVVDGVLFQPLPFHQPDELVRLHHVNREDAVTSGKFSPPDLEDLEASTTAFQSLASFHHEPGSGMALRGVGEPVQIGSANVSGDFFSTLGVPARAGRVFTPQEDRPGFDRVAVISHALWRSRFGGDPGVVGRTVSLEGEPFTIVGVMPASFTYPSPAVEVWVPISLIGEDDIPRQRGLRWMQVIGRLRPGVEVERARAEVDAVVRRLAEAYPESNEQWTTAQVEPLHHAMVGDVRPALLTLLAAVALVLLIACANLANLLLARGSGRGRELAVRTALGAHRGRLVRQLVTESLVIALIGGVVGLLLALGGVSALTALIEGNLPRPEAIRPSARVIGFTFLVTILTGLLFGLFPALRVSRGSTASMLREGGRTGTAGRGRFGVRAVIVVAETALAVVLLVSAGLMIKSFWRIVNIDPGFQAENVLAVGLRLPDNAGEGPGMTHVRRERLVDRIEQIPGVVAVGTSKTLPLHGGGEPWEFTLPDRPEMTVRPGAGAILVNPGYFRALGIPMLRGRSFTDQDTTGTPVIVVNEALARQVWPGEDAVGKMLRFGTTDLLVAGVAGNVRIEGLTQEPEPALYVPSRLAPRSSVKFFVRTTESPVAMMGAVRQAIQEVDPNQPIAEMAALDRMVSETVAQPRLFAMLLGIFGAIALVLAVIGIYGVIAYGVAQRTREIGIRMALGAARGAVLRMVVGQSAILSATGLLVGIVGALLLTRVLSSQLYGVAPTDPATFAGVALLLGGAALLAGYIPARRAVRVDPTVALREE